MELFSKPDLCGYFILISPSLQIKEDVKRLKHQFEMENGEYPGLHSQAHITLMNFPQGEEREEKLIQSVANIAAKIHSFEVSVSGIGFFESNHTFYLKLENECQIISLYQLLVVELWLNQIPKKYLRSTITPHITIGRSMNEQQFVNAYRKFNGWTYTKNFRVNAITILKRSSTVEPWVPLVEVPIGRDR